MSDPRPDADTPKAKLPFRRYRITFLPARTTLEVDPENLPYGRTGLPGSILDASCAAGGVKIDHACGGVCACSTCHVIIREGIEACNEMTETEADMLDHAPGVTTRSRLACQTVPDGSRDLVVEVPDWNRNYAREFHQ
ncbi:MAG: 2Fe-2S iron-sulfur cluster-binding protein [Acidobacteriota bacterium]